MNQATEIDYNMPAPSAEPVMRKAKFWNKVAEKYARRPVSDEAAYQQKLATTQGYFRPDMEVLELGCGTGSTAIVHAPHVKHIHAVDIADNMLDIARRKTVAAGITNITYETADVDSLDLPDDSVDAVLALNLLHLLEDKEDALARIHAWLKPGGILVSSTVCIGDSMPWFKLVIPLGRLLGLVPIVKVFTAQHMADAITAAGFAIDHDWRPPEVLFAVAKKNA